MPAAAATRGPTRRHAGGLALKATLALSLLAGQAVATACNCFSPELRLKTGRETLQLARLAIFGTVVALDVDGAARVQVLESFKGPAPGETVTLQPGAAACAAPMPPPGRQVLVVGFDQGLNACTQYEADHFLLETFRRVAAEAR